MKLKYFFVTILPVLFFTPKKLGAQTENNQVYIQCRPIDSEIILNSFSNLAFREIVEDTVLFTTLGKKSKSLDLTREEFKEYIFRNYFQSNLKFRLSSVTNDGYAILLEQYLEDREIPMRTFTLFLSHKTGKIIVVEIEENK
jgi:hypothetical protein